MTEYGTPTWQFNLHWQNDQDLYNAVLDYSRALLKRVPSMTPQTLGRNMRDNVWRWCTDGYVSALGWGPEDGKRGRPRVDVVSSDQLARFPGFKVPAGFRSVAPGVLAGMVKDMDGQWHRVDETEVGESIMENLDGEEVVAVVRGAGQ